MSVPTDFDGDHPPSRRKPSVVRALALVYGIPLVLMIIGVAGWRHLNPTFELAEEEDIFAVVSGRWDWLSSSSFCVDETHTISFSDDRTLMVLTQSSPGVEDSLPQRWEYDIVMHDRTRIRGRMRGEERLDVEGEPVVWDLVLQSRDAYRWKRTDLPIFGYSGNVERCDEQLIPDPDRAPRAFPEAGAVAR